MSVGTRAKRGGVVGSNQQPVIPVVLKRLVQWSDNLPVDLLEGLDLGIRIPLVRCLVRRFHVHTDNIHSLQRLEGGLALGSIIGVRVAGCTSHLDQIPANQGGDSPKQVDSSDHQPLLAVLLLEGGKLESLAQSPEPDIGCRKQPGGDSLPIHRVVFEEEC